MQHFCCLFPRTAELEKYFLHTHAHMAYHRAQTVKSSLESLSPSVQANFTQIFSLQKYL